MKVLPRILLAMLAASSTAGCGLDDLGVLSVHVSLEPVLVEVPAELEDVLDSAAFAAGTGTIHTDVPTGTGTVEAFELPELPEGLYYAPMLQLAEHARSGLPQPGGSAGHAHGLDEGGDAESEDDHAEETEAGGSVMLSRMQLLEHDDWLTLFGASDLGAFELGAIRGGVIVIATNSGPLAPGLDTLPVLAGEVDFEGEGSTLSDEEEEGHAHGI